MSSGAPFRSPKIPCARPYSGPRDCAIFRPPGDPDQNPELNAAQLQAIIDEAVAICKTTLERSKWSKWSDETGILLSQTALSFQNLPREAATDLFALLVESDDVPVAKRDVFPGVTELIHLLCELYQLPFPSAWLLEVSRILYNFALADTPGFTFRYYGKPGGPPGACHLHLLEYFRTYLVDPYGAEDSVPVQEIILLIFHRTHTLTFDFVMEFAGCLTDELLYHACRPLALIWWDDPINVTLRIGGSIARTVGQTLEVCTTPEIEPSIKFSLLEKLFAINFREDRPSVEFWELLAAFATPCKGPECFLMRGVLASLLPYQSFLFFLISDFPECHRHVARICNLLMIQNLPDPYPETIDFATIFQANGLLIKLAALIPNLPFEDARITINTIVTYLPELRDEPLLGSGDEPRLALLSSGFLENLANFRCPGANWLRLRALSTILEWMVNMHESALIVYGGQIIIHKLLPWHFEETDLEEEEDQDDGDEGSHEDIDAEDRDQKANVVIDTENIAPEVQMQFEQKFDSASVWNNWPYIRNRLRDICGKDMDAFNHDARVSRLEWMANEILASEAEEKTRRREVEALNISLGRQGEIARMAREGMGRVNAALDRLCGGPD
jgi:hypothetical protein